MMNLANGTTKYMKPGIHLLAVAAFVLLLAGPSGAQDNPMISLDTGSDSLVFSAPINATDGVESCNSAPGLFQQTGGFYGTYGYGVEYTMRRTESHWYGSLFLGGITAPGDEITGSQAMLMSGLTVGYETLLHGPKTRNQGEVLRADVEGTQYYLRIGPGVGVTSVSHRDRQFETHPTIFTHTTVGALRGISRKASIFAEFGGRLGYIPTLSEMHFVGGPHLSLGFLISIKETISPFKQ